MQAFKDIYDKTLYQAPIKSPTSIKINGIDLMAYGFVLTEHPDIMFPEIRTRYQELNRFSGSRNHGSCYGNRSFSIVGHIHGMTHQDAFRKWDRLKNWLDSQNSIQNEYLVNSFYVTGLVLEVCHRYWYDTGTVTGTSGQKTLTGTSTEWDKFISAEGILEIQGHDQVYTVVNVTSDTSIEIVPALTGSITNANYRVERKRYLFCTQDGEGSIDPIASSGYLSQTKVGSTQSYQASNIYRVSIPFTSTYPYWIGGCVTNKQTSLISGTFLEMKNAGNAASTPLYGALGVTDSVKITACEMAFHGVFDLNLKASDLLNNGIITPNVQTGTITYDFANGDTGVFVDAETIAYTTLTGNNTQWGFHCRISPNFDSDTASVDDKYIFDFFDSDNSDAIKLFYDVSDDDWVVNIRSASVDNTTFRTTNTQNFNLGNYLELSGWYKNTGRIDPKDGTTYYGKILVNGEVVGTLTSTVTAPAVTLTKLLVGALVNVAATPTSQLWANSTISELTIFVYPPTDEELLGFYTQQLPIPNLNATITTTQSLATDDLLFINTFDGYSSKYDVGANTVTPLTQSGNESHFLGRNDSQMIYVTAGATIPEFYTVYYPTWL